MCRLDENVQDKRKSTGWVKKYRLSEKVQVERKITG
jgi:hypothetical protein